MKGGEGRHLSVVGLEGRQAGDGGQGGGQEGEWRWRSGGLKEEVTSRCRGEVERRWWGDCPVDCRLDGQSTATFPPNADVGANGASKPYCLTASASSL